MWPAITQSSQDTKRNSNLKQLKLVPTQPNSSEVNTNQPSDMDPNAMPAIWRKELRLTTVVDRQRKKLSMSSSSTSTSYSHASSRGPPTPFDLPRLDHRLTDLDEKLEAIENKMSARQQMFELLSKDSTMLNSDLQKDLQRYSQSFQPSQSKPSQESEENQDSNPDVTQGTSTETHTQLQQDSSSSTQPAAAPATSSDSAASLGWGEYFINKLW